MFSYTFDNMAKIGFFLENSEHPFWVQAKHILDSEKVDEKKKENMMRMLLLFVNKHNS